MATESEDFSKSEIDAGGAGQRMQAVFQRRDAVIDEAGGTAPDGNVSIFDTQAAH